MQNLECPPSVGQKERFRPLKDCGSSWEETPHQRKAYRNTSTFRIAAHRLGKPHAAVRLMTRDPVAGARQRRTFPPLSGAIARTGPDLREPHRAASSRAVAYPSSQAASVAASDGVCVVLPDISGWLSSADPYAAQGKSRPESVAASWTVSSSPVQYKQDKINDVCSPATRGPENGYIDGLNTLTPN